MSLVILGVLCFVILLPAIRILAALHYAEKDSSSSDSKEEV